MRRIEGFSLVELVLVIAILGILAVFVGPVLYNAIRAYDTVQTSGQTQAKVRYAVERMSREIREIRRRVTDVRALDIATMTTNTLTFVNTQGRTIVIARTGNTLTLSDTTLSGVLTDQINAFSLAYFQPNASTVAANASSLGFVQISLAVSEGSAVFASRVRVDIRNTP
jgi:prepilin-type N-terminal cleavage/methylation domain-containing protein